MEIEPRLAAPSRPAFALCAIRRLQRSAHARKGRGAALALKTLLSQCGRRRSAATSLDHPVAVEALWKPQPSPADLQRSPDSPNIALKHLSRLDLTYRDPQLLAHGKEGVIGSSPMLGLAVQSWRSQGRELEWAALATFVLPPEVLTPPAPPQSDSEDRATSEPRSVGVTGWLDIRFPFRVCGRRRSPSGELRRCFRNRRQPRSRPRRAPCF